MKKRSKRDILCENLEFVTERLSLSSEQYRVCAEMLADSICTEMPDASPEALYECFNKRLPRHDVIAATSMCRRIRAGYRSGSRYDCQLAAELFGMNVLPAAGSHGRISYVRNKYNERAYEHFAGIVSNAKFSYAASFAESCEDVIGERCEYAILPVENSNDGRLFGFYSLLDRYELRICAVVRIDTDDATDTVRYALVGRTLPITINSERMCDIEFSIAREDETRLADFLRAAGEFSAHTRKIDTRPLEYDHDLYRYYFTFSLPCSEAYALGLYLSLEYPSFTLIGFYPSTE